MNSKTSQIAVIGAGISGLAAARFLHLAGAPVQIFEKSRGVGGRMATRRHTDHTFDHGAQYFTVRDPRFRSLVEAGLERGTIAYWPKSKPIVAFENGTQREVDPNVIRYVGVPGMNAVCKQLAMELKIQKESRIEQLERRDCRWYLCDTAGHRYGPFKTVVVSAPAEQTATLIGDHSPTGTVAANSAMSPCWAAMIRFAQPLTDRWSGAFLNDARLSWAAQNHLKPQRGAPYGLVIHADPDWSRQHIESSPDWIGEAMLRRFFQVTNLPIQVPQSIVAHRWRYAIPDPPSSSAISNQDHQRQAGSLRPAGEGENADAASCNAADQWDAKQSVGICGDWCRGGRVEGAYLSGLELAERIMNDAGIPEKT